MAGEKILIVDDEADVLDLCKRILATRGYHVKTARNGQEVVEIAQQEHFDLLLTDIRMPGMSGLEVAQTLKNSEPGVICITMTGYSTMDMAIEALKLGIDEFIMKPFSPEELSITVSKALEKERLRKENFRLRSLIPLFELNKTLMGTVEVEKVLRCLLDISQKETNADFAGLYTFQGKNSTAYFRCKEDERVREEVQLEVAEASHKLAQFISENGQQLILNLREAGKDYHAILQQLQMRFVIVTPLKSKEANLGALILGRRDSDFASGDSDFLSVLSSQASIALENANLFTEIQEAYKELQMLDHMKSEFINIAAHELRTPLAILMGYATMLEEDLEGSQRDYMTTIMRNAMRLSSLIDDMLNLQYLDSGVASLANDDLDLHEAIREAIDDMALLAEQKNLNITVDIPDDFPRMIVDRQKFDLIVVNLINNAVKFTPTNEHIMFKATANGEMATMSVTNTGVNIPKEKLSRIFDRFYQVESSLTREHGGIGLGLSIVRGMIDVCGGEIYVESEEGQGTTFTFTLPVDNTRLGSRVLKI